MLIYYIGIYVHMDKYLHLYLKKKYTAKSLVISVGGALRRGRCQLGLQVVALPWSECLYPPKFIY